MKKKLTPLVAPLDLRLEHAAEQRPVDKRSVYARFEAVAKMTLEEYFFQCPDELEKISEILSIAPSEPMGLAASRIVRLSEFDRKKSDEALWLFVAPLARLGTIVKWKGELS